MNRNHSVVLKFCLLVKKLLNIYDINYDGIFSM